MVEEHKNKVLPSALVEPRRVYANQGNLPLINLMPVCKRVLDVGCGAGDNARLIRARMPDCSVYGITHSEAEALVARQTMVECWVYDLESADAHPPDQRFDLLLFSHVLEHLRDPAEVLKRYTDRLEPGGSVLIAVPNVLFWRMRIQFLLGDFEYDTAGVLDDTHLRFFTYFTADRFLLAKAPELDLVFKSAIGSLPLWWVRRHLLPSVWCEHFDQWACRHWPNLFGDQILLSLRKQ